MALANLKLVAGIAAAVVLTGTVGVVSYNTLIAAAPPAPASRPAPAPANARTGALIGGPMNAATAAATAPAALGEIDPDMAALMAKKLPELNFQDIAVDDVIDFLRDVTGANIYVNSRALQPLGAKPDKRISMRVLDISLADALRQIVQQMAPRGATFLATENVIFITAADDVPRVRAAQQWRANMPVDEKTRVILDRQLPEVNMKAIGFSDVINFLRDVAGANIFVNWRALEVAGVKQNQPVSFRLRDVPLRTVLWILLESAQVKPDGALDFQVEQGVINISTPADLAKSSKLAAAATTTTTKPAPTPPAPAPPR